MKRYSIVGIQYGCSEEIELAQVATNPQATLDGFANKKLLIETAYGSRMTSIGKYSCLRIIDRGEQS